MWALRNFPTGKSLLCIKGFLSVSLKGHHEINTRLRNLFGDAEIESKGARPWWDGC